MAEAAMAIEKHQIHHFAPGKASSSYGACSVIAACAPAWTPDLARDRRC
jgi:hypothetical protein